LPAEVEHFRAPTVRPIGAPATQSLSWLYLLYALPMVLFLAVTMPPFQVTDETNHALRADQLSRGKLISPRLGSHVDGALRTFGRLYEDMHFHYEVKHTEDLARAVAALAWNVPDQDENFQNTAQYGPLLYLPQAAGISIGKLAGLNPFRTLLVARLVNAAVAVLIAFVAIRICRRGIALLFTTLLLPMTVSQFGSMSQDALIISLSLLVVGIASRIIAESRPAKTWEFALFVAVVVATTLARPSQFAMTPLGLFFFVTADKSWRPKVAVAALGAILVIAWLVLLPKLMPEEPQGASVSGQLHEVIRHPLLLLRVLYNTFREGGFWLFETLVSRLGWLDTPLPRWLTWTAAGALACAWLAPGNLPPWLFPAAIGCLTFVAVLANIAVALYASWTPIGKMTIDSAQGRYILPILPLLAFLAPVYGARLARFLSPTWILVVAFPLVSMAVLPAAIMERYYGSWSNMGAVLKILFH
jgi:uncharacterized membrane protein